LALRADVLETVAEALASKVGGYHERVFSELKTHVPGLAAAVPRNAESIAALGFERSWADALAAGKRYRLSPARRAAGPAPPEPEAASGKEARLWLSTATDCTWAADYLASVSPENGEELISKLARVFARFAFDLRGGKQIARATCEAVSRSLSHLVPVLGMDKQSTSEPPAIALGLELVRWTSQELADLRLSSLASKAGSKRARR
jgi:hypothetical protein